MFSQNNHIRFKCISGRRIVTEITRRSIFVLSFFIAIPYFVYCETPSDSLRKLLPSTSDPERKADLYVLIAKSSLTENSILNGTTSEKYADTALNYSKGIEYRKGEAEALLLKGKCKLISKNQLDQATLCFLNSLRLFETLNDSNGIAGCNMQLGLVSLELINYSDAISFFRKAYINMPPKSQYKATLHYLIAGDAKAGTFAFDPQPGRSREDIKAGSQVSGVPFELERSP